MKDLIVVLKEYHNKKIQREDITTSETYSFTEITNLKRVRTLSFSQTEIISLSISKNVTETSEYTFKQCKSFKKENN